MFYRKPPIARISKNLLNPATCFFYDGRITLKRGTLSQEPTLYPIDPWLTHNHDDVMF